MFEKRSCVLRLGFGAGMQGTGAAAERATVNESAPSQSARAPAAVGTSRQRTKHRTRGAIPERRHTRAAWSGASARSVTRAFSPAPSPLLSPDALRRACLYGEGTRGFDAQGHLHGVVGEVHGISPVGLAKGPQGDGQGGGELSLGGFGAACPHCVVARGGIAGRVVGDPPDQGVLLHWVFAAAQRMNPGERCRAGSRRTHAPTNDSPTSRRSLVA